MKTIKNPCSTGFFGKKNDCHRLKREELGNEMAVEGYSCEYIAGVFRSLGYFERPSLTADSDYDLVNRYHKDRQLHVRLRDYGEGCLITMHNEPADVSWHVSCGFADKVLGERKPEWCKVSYLSPEKLQRTIDMFRSKEEWI